jgi:osomolarity two-component system sensor histidine kinase NIK1
MKAALESNVISPMGAIDDSSFAILLAEDNHVNQRIALKFLEKYGHQVEIAENGAMAVDMYKQRCADHRSFDIVLVSRLVTYLMMIRSDSDDMQMDVSMPIMDGMVATELIRKYENSLNLERTPIIALTAHASTFDDVLTAFVA